MKSGLDKVPCLYTDGNAPVTALIENIIRENLTAIEEAEAIEKLRVQNDYTHEELSEVIGKARSTMTETLKINSLPEEIKNDCRNISSFPKSVLISLNDIESDEEKLKLYNQYKQKEITRDEIRRASQEAAAF